MGTRLFVGNLSYNVTELELKEAFTSEGIEVRSVRLACERETGRPRGFAFVETATDDGAKQSIEKISGRMLQGRAVVVEEAQARPAPGGARPGGPGPSGFPRFGGPRPQGGPPGAGGGPPRFSGPAAPSSGPPRSFGPPRPPSEAGGFDRTKGKPEGRRERPEKKRSSRPKPEERERGNWRWKGVLDED